MAAVVVDEERAERGEKTHAPGRVTAAKAAPPVLAAADLYAVEGKK